MEQNKNPNTKDFESSEINQEMKISDDNEIQTLDYQIIQLIIARIIIFFIVVLIVFVIVFLYNENKKKQLMYESLNNLDQNQDIINPYFRMMGINSSNIIYYKPFEMKHYKPDNMDLKYYSRYLPSNQNNEIISDMNDLFNNKYLLINNPEINFDYIYVLRQNDFEPGRFKNLTFENLSFFQEYENQDLKEIKDFYLLCERAAAKKKQKAIKSHPNPLISVIIAFYNQEQKIIRTIKSVQMQSLYNIEIIIVKDNNTDLEDYSNVIEKDERIRIFTQNESYGLWRKRMDGFLYSKGKYILHMDAGHILSDKLVLHDVLRMCERYDIDTIRFTYSRNIENKKFKKNIEFAPKKIYDCNDTKIQYGIPNYDVHQFDYKIIWTRLVKAELFSKGLDLLDPIILNVKQNVWEDMWWNELINNVSFSNLIINRLGYIYFENKNIEFQPCLDNDIEKDKTINDLLYCFYFDTLILDPNNEKKPVIINLRKFNKTNGSVDGIPMKLDFLRKKSDIFFILIKKLLFDPAVMFVDKIYIKDLLDSTRLMIRKKKEESRAKLRAERLALIKEKERKEKEEKERKEKEEKEKKAKEEKEMKEKKEKEKEEKEIKEKEKVKVKKAVKNQKQSNKIYNNTNNFANTPINNQNNQLGNNYQQRQQQNKFLNPQYNNNIINQNYNGQINYNQKYNNNQINQNNRYYNQNNNYQPINQVNNNNQYNQGINQINNNQQMQNNLNNKKNL